MGWRSSQFGLLQEISTPDPNSKAGQALHEPTKEVTPSGDGSITLLMMGVDAREGEQIDIGVRPDSLSVLHINPNAQTCLFRCACRVRTSPMDQFAWSPFS